MAKEPFDERRGFTMLSNDVWVVAANLGNERSRRLLFHLALLLAANDTDEIQISHKELADGRWGRFGFLQHCGCGLRESTIQVALDDLKRRSLVIHVNDGLKKGNRRPKGKYRLNHRKIAAEASRIIGRISTHDALSLVESQPMIGSKNDLFMGQMLPRNYKKEEQESAGSVILEDENKRKLAYEALVGLVMRTWQDPALRESAERDLQLQAERKGQIFGDTTRSRLLGLSVCPRDIAKFLLRDRTSVPWSCCPDIDDDDANEVLSQLPDSFEELAQIAQSLGAV